MNRRIWSFIALALLSLSLNATKQPNVILIIADDLNHYGFYETYPGVKMPAMDSFKEQSITFQHAYCASPVCGPSRAAIFSGLYPHHTGAYLNGSDPWRKAPLDNTESMVEVFKRSGYTTWGGGKLTHAKLAEGREKAMYDNEVFHGGFKPYLDEEYRIGDGGSNKFWGSQPWEGPDSDFPDVVNAEKAIEFLEQKHEKPFLMVYGLWRPHNPYTAPKRFFDIYDEDFKNMEFPPPGYDEADLDDIPPYGHKLSAIWGHRWENSGIEYIDNWKRIVWGYVACTTFADWSMGRVIEALDKSDYADNTIVIVTSDNGYHLGEKNHFEKATLWELSALTPTAIRLPGQKNAGTVAKQPINTIDLFPTLIEMCDLESPDHQLDGTSIKPILDDPTIVWEQPAITTYGEKVFSARTPKFRYIQYPDGEEELYDHDKDPHEIHNLADQKKFQKVLKKFRSYIPEEWAPSQGGRNG